MVPALSGPSLPKAAASMRDDVDGRANRRLKDPPYVSFFTSIRIIVESTHSSMYGVHMKY